MGKLKSMKMEISTPEKLRTVFIGLVALTLGVFVGFPLITLIIKAFKNYQGEFVGMKNFIEYLKLPGVGASFKNTITVSTVTTIISLILGFFYTYGIVRCNVSNKKFLKWIALLPLFAPTMLHGISLVYLFGRMGAITTGFFGNLPFLQMDINLYGPVGIIISEVIYTFPQVYLMLSIALGNSDYRLYEAAKTLGTSSIKQFFKITLPSCKYGIFSAITLCFILAFTDFGAPKVVGGNYNVLATDIYKQVVGQQNMERGAVISLLLLIPAVIAFLIENNIAKKQRDVFNGKSMAYRIEKSKIRDTIFNVFCHIVAVMILIVFITPVVASFVKMWPYNFSLTLANYKFFDFNGGAFAFYKNSIVIASLTGIVGTILAYIGAYFSLKTKGMENLKKLMSFLAIIPLALPGMVLGLAFIFFFNMRTINLPVVGGVYNIFNVFYGTIWILVLVNVMHFYSVAYMTASTGLKKLDKEFEIVSLSMGIPWYKTLFQVTIPLTKDVIGEIFIYYFLNAMTTVSAIIFLYTSKTTVASIAMVNLDDAGEQARAAAMGVLIITTNLIVKAIYEKLKERHMKKMAARKGEESKDSRLALAKYKNIFGGKIKSLKIPVFGAK